MNETENRQVSAVGKSKAHSCANVPLLTLDGEDVCLCLGADRDKLAFTFGKTVEHYATLVVVLSNPLDPHGAENAVSFAHELESLDAMMTQPTPRRFVALSVGDWLEISG